MPASILDDLDQLRSADPGGFFGKLLALPGSYDGPDGVLPEPYGLVGYGEAAPLVRLLQGWVDAPLVVAGTQFMFGADFDFGELAPLRLSAEMAGAGVVVLGHPSYEPTLRVGEGPLSLYTYASYLARATGRAEALAAAERALVAIRDLAGPENDGGGNPAKTLAWTLWNRIPLVVAGRSQPGVSEIAQHVFARVGKTLALSLADHPLSVLSSAFETRHALGDDLVAVTFAPLDEETRLAAEVLGTRAAQVETVTLPIEQVSDPGARGLAIWYFLLWVAAYLAVLSGQDPQEGAVYEALREAAVR